MEGGDNKMPKAIMEFAILLKQIHLNKVKGKKRRTLGIIYDAFLVGNADAAEKLSDEIRYSQKTVFENEEIATFVSNASDILYTKAKKKVLEEEEEDYDEDEEHEDAYEYEEEKLQSELPNINANFLKYLLDSQSES
jgi:hypothetical protein